MKATSAWKLFVMQRAIKDGMKPRITLYGTTGAFTVEAVTDLKHTLELQLDRTAGVMAITHDDIQTVWTPRPVSHP